ncbi:MFS transporter [Pseudomonas sp. ML96]|uniref:MFS transporter n=1 Tax=Pseudomonas sp. ML96 TaxID=1523503 RepID=UPI0005BA0220|nr:MFS transporter [Pseudomonas sp. ML96]
MSEHRLRKILSGLLLALFLAALDQTIVAVVLPDISRDLPHAEYLPWVVSAYLLAMTVATPIAGKLGDLFGRARLLYGSLLAFILASILCSLARDVGELVAARALQGIGAGAMMTCIQSLIGELISPAERGRYQAWFSGMFAIASLAGPLLGSLIGQWSWRGIFLINLPLGLAALFLAQRGLAGLASSRMNSRVDYLGCMLLTLGLGCVMMLVIRFGHEQSWSSTIDTALLLVGTLGTALFIAWQRHASEPLIPPSLLRIPTLRASLLLMLFSSFLSVGLGMLIPLHAESGQAISLLIALAAGIPIGAYTGGRLSAQLKRYKPLILTGCSALPPTLACVAWVEASWLALPGLMLTGIALGLQFPTVLVAVQNAAPRAQLGIATACCGLVRGLGGALGAALLMSLFTALNTWQPGHAFGYLMLLCSALALAPLLIAWRMEDQRLAEKIPSH